MEILAFPRAFGGCLPPKRTDRKIPTPVRRSQPKKTPPLRRPRKTSPRIRPINPNSAGLRDPIPPKHARQTTSIGASLCAVLRRDPRPQAPAARLPSDSIATAARSSPILRGHHRRESLIFADEDTRTQTHKDGRQDSRIALDVIQAPKRDLGDGALRTERSGMGGDQTTSPNKPRGAPRADDWRVLNGIFLGAAFGRAVGGFAGALRAAHQGLQSLQPMAKGWRFAHCAVAAKAIDGAGVTP
jgi:hypothetical protein